MDQLFFREPFHHVGDRGHLDIQVLRKIAHADFPLFSGKVEQGFQVIFFRQGVHPDKGTQKFYVRRSGALLLKIFC
jgi:hypothetical protein